MLAGARQFGAEASHHTPSNVQPVRAVSRLERLDILMSILVFCLPKLQKAGVAWSWALSPSFVEAARLTWGHQIGLFDPGKPGTLAEHQ